MELELLVRSRGKILARISPERYKVTQTDSQIMEVVILKKL